MKILFLSPWHPFPANNGSKLRIYHLLEGLAQEHEIDLITFVREPGEKGDNSRLAELCRRVQVVPWIPFEPDGWRARAGFLSPKPRAVVDTFSHEMANCISRTLAADQFDVVIASEITMAGYASTFRQCPAVLEDIELGVLYEQFAHAKTVRDRLRYGLTWSKHHRYLRRLLRDFRACTVVSETERQLLREQVGGQVEEVVVIPNCVDVSHYAGVSAAARRDSIIFTGALTYGPNYEAMTWFLEKVYPAIQAQNGNVSLTVTGKRVDLSLPPAGNVTLTGFVDDIRPLIAGSAISIAPIWTGAGTRLKILEAMALKTPVVSTTKGAEGLEVIDNKHLLLADTPEAFAQSVLRLLEDEGLREEIAEEAFRLVAAKYDWSRVLRPFLSLLDRLV